MPVSNIKVSMPKQGQTSIRLSKSTRDRLDKLGTRHESYDSIINRFLDDVVDHIGILDELAARFPVVRKYMDEKISYKETRQRAIDTRRQLEKEIKG